MQVTEECLKCMWGKAVCTPTSVGCQEHRVEVGHHDRGLVVPVIYIGLAGCLPMSVLHYGPLYFLDVLVLLVESQN